MDKDLKVIDNLVKSLEKKFGEDSVGILGQESNQIERWELSSLNLTDLTCGGVPKGRIIEVYGPESHGKTTLATILASDIQKLGGNIAIIDTEHSWDPIYAQTFGLDSKKCIFSQPIDGESAIDLVIALAESEKISLIIVDSVASLTPREEIEGDTSDKQMGAQARLMGKACRKLVSILGKTKTIVVFTNQIRQKIGVIYGNPETTPGGLALKFHASIRMEVRKSEYIKDENQKIIGFISNVKTTKNKVGIPFKKREIKVIYGKGLQLEDEFIDFALETGVITRKGTWYFYDPALSNEGDECKLGQGREAVIKNLKSNVTLAGKLEYETRQRLNKNSLSLVSIPEEEMRDTQEKEMEESNEN